MLARRSYFCPDIRKSGNPVTGRKIDGCLRASSEALFTYGHILKASPIAGECERISPSRDRMPAIALSDVNLEVSGPKNMINIVSGSHSNFSEYETFNENLLELEPCLTSRAENEAF